MHNGAIAGLLANSPLCPQPKQKAGGCKTNRSTSHSIRSDNSPLHQTNTQAKSHLTAKRIIPLVNA